MSQTLLYNGQRSSGEDVTPLIQKGMRTLDGNNEVVDLDHQGPWLDDSQVMFKGATI